MALATIGAGTRYSKITTDTAAALGFPYIELGPAGTIALVSTLMVQFDPDVSFTGNFVVLGKILGQAAQNAGTPFVPIGYRRWSLNNVASDYTIVSDPITGPALIEVPANGLSIMLLDGLTTGTMNITSWDLQGTASV